MSSKVKFCPFQHFVGERVHNSETRRAPQKSVFDTSFNALLQRWTKLRPKIDGLASVNNNTKNSRFTKMFFFFFFFSVITFDSINARHPYSQYPVPLTKTRRMNYHLTLKGHVENLAEGQGHVTWSEKLKSHISRSVSSAWTHIKCFRRSNMSLSRVFVEKLLVTFDDLKWSRGHEEGSLVTIFWFTVSSLPVTWCLRMFRMVFV